MTDTSELEQLRRDRAALWTLLTRQTRTMRRWRHRDYQGNRGAVESVAWRMQRCGRLRRERDEARAELARLRSHPKLKKLDENLHSAGRNENPGDSLTIDADQIIHAAGGDHATAAAVLHALAATGDMWEADILTALANDIERTTL